MHRVLAAEGVLGGAGNRRYNSPMTRECFFCHRPLSIEQRTTVFCSLRCQTLASQLEAGGPRGAPRRHAPRGKGALRPPPEAAGKPFRRPSANR